MAIPRERTPDSSLALLREGYEFVTTRCRRHGADTFATRLMLRPVVCMQGAEAARFFTTTPMTRRGAVPRPLLALVQDVGSVATLDGEMHRCRKAMFLGMMSDEELARLERISDAEWRLAAERWRRADRVLLLPAAEELLCRVACEWAGVPRIEPEASRRAAEPAAMVDGAGSIGPCNVRGPLRRRSSERWAAAAIRAIRAGRVSDGGPRPTPAAAIARHRDADGRPLADAVAAVELLNLLRPIVATARFVAFAALALHRHPGAAAAEGSGDAGRETAFVHEVRRFYPFFPAIGGRLLGAAVARRGAACRAVDAARPPRDEPRPTHVGPPGAVRAGSVSRVARRCLHVRAAGRRRPRRRPSLPPASRRRSSSSEAPSAPSRATSATPCRSRTSRSTGATFRPGRQAAS